jgi:mycothiol synthase
VTTLFYVGGYSQREIADFLELSDVAVAKRLFSARRRLKQGLAHMVEEDLKQHRPSRDDAFVARVQARLRPFAEPDWDAVTSLARGVGPDLRRDPARWLRERRQFDERHYTRRHYVAEHADTGQILGYGAVEQTIFLPKYRLSLVVAPEHWRSGVGELLLDRLMKDLREVNAIAVWHRGDDRLTDGLAFLKERGFVQTSVACELRLPLSEFDAAPFAPTAARVTARGVSIASYAEERERDPDHLCKLHELLNAVMADEPGRQPFAAVPLDTVARWFSRQSLLPDACFIARRGGHYVGMTSASLFDDGEGCVTQGFTGVLREHRRQGIATALKLCVIEFARQYGHSFVRAFNDPANLAALALNEKLGFRRRLTSVTLEKCLREVKPVDPAVYDAYAGRYAFDPAHLKAHGLPDGLTALVKRVGPRLISEIRDMQDELLPESESRFFITMHYGEVEFIRGHQGRVEGLIYRESGKEMRAARVE